MDKLPVDNAPRPYKLGVTSYVYPADILPNVEAVAGLVDDVELVLFESSDVSNLPSMEVVDRLDWLARDNGMTYTVHFPIDRKLGSESRSEREEMVRQSRAIMELTRRLPVWAYILHPEGITAAADAERVRVWQGDLYEAAARVVDGCADPSLFCLENLGFPFEWCDGLLSKLGLGVCIDTGHVWLGGGDIAAHAVKYIERARVMHLHGERDGRDHISLENLDEARLSQVGGILGTFRGVVTLEVFDYESTASSIRMLGRL